MTSATGPGTSGAARPPSIALIGTHGHGTTHLRHVRDLETRGAARLTAVVDPRPLAEAADAARARARGERVAAVDDIADGTIWYPDFDALLAVESPDVVILCTPIDTHAALAETALRTGCDVLLEKPPAASLAEFEHLMGVTHETGGRLQVGFQTYGSHALAVVRSIVADGEIGDVIGIGGVGTWVRPQEYWTRSPWAGRRTLDGRAVIDGVVTNPLAHAVATALLLAGASTAEDVAKVEVDLAHANSIEADDTSSVRVTTSEGLRVALGLTLCATTSTSPRLVVHGTNGRVVLQYTRDVVVVTGSRGTRTITCGRTDLLENLLAHRADPDVPQLASLPLTGAFMRVLEAVRTAPEPRTIDPALVDRVDDDEGTHLVVRGVEDWCERVAESFSTFRELGAPWTGGTA